jgi:hypothetical protein
MNTEKNEHPPAKQPNKYQWIKDIARQSWEPELFISGAAAFASLGLPGLIKSGYALYIQNLMGNGFIEQLFPLLIFSVLVSVAQILSITFFVHLTMRAFWIGMMGLSSVYPKGIELDKIPTLSNYAKQYLGKKLMTVDDFIIKLDRTCSMLFSIAFIIILFLVNIALMYTLAFLVVFASSFVIPDSWQSVYQIILGVLLGIFMLFSIVFALLVQNQRKKKHDQEKYDRLYFLFNYRVTQIIMPGMISIMPYVLYPFSSNSSKKRSVGGVIVVAILFMVLLMANIRAIDQRIPSPETRQYYSSGSDEHKLAASYYENLRDNSQMVHSLTIQSDMIKEPVLKLFIAYPKKLDAMLKKICGALPEPSEKLSREERRRKADAQKLTCFARLYQVYINGEKIKAPDFMYYQSPAHDTKGIIAYIPLRGLKYGSKNILEVKSSIPQVSSNEKRRKPLNYRLPFWYLVMEK